MRPLWLHSASFAHAAGAGGEGALSGPRCGSPMDVPFGSAGSSGGAAFLLLLASLWRTRSLPGTEGAVQPTTSAATTRAAVHARLPLGPIPSVQHGGCQHPGPLLTAFCGQEDP